MNILGVGAHYDDLELGCSGSLIRHVQQGDSVTMMVVTDSGFTNPTGELIRPTDIALAEGTQAAEIIGADLICLNYKTFMVPFDEILTRTILEHVERLKIDMIYSHWTHDIHRDHQMTARATLMAGRHVPRFLMYRSNFYDTDDQFKGNLYTDISDVMDQKQKVIQAHRSELERIRYKWLDFFTSQNANDGKKIGVDYAECFEVVRFLV